MSLFYDRSDNLGGSVTTGALSGWTPAYGSRVSFESKVQSKKMMDGYHRHLPNSINNLTAKFEMRYDVVASEAQQIIRTVERTMDKITGQRFGVNWQMPSEFYQQVKVECKNYSVNHITKNHYEVALSLESNRGSPMLDWKTMSYLNFTPSDFNAGSSYEKYDVCYISGAGTVDRFHYHSADSSSGAFSTGNWSQEFFFSPDIGFQNEVNMNVDSIGFSNSFTTYGSTQKHISALDFSYKFSNITNAQAKCILHFLESKAGYRRFKHTMPSIYTTRPKVFFAPSWGHTFNYFNSHTIEVRMIEDPLGIVPTNQ